MVNECSLEFKIEGIAEVKPQKFLGSCKTEAVTQVHFILLIKMGGNKYLIISF